MIHDADFRLLCGDVTEQLATLPDGSVHCVVTSPPYWGLRDYGVAGQLGLEPTIDAHIERLVHVFREVRRVLRDDGTLWLNYGDRRSDNREWLGIPHRLVFALQADGWRWEDEIVWSKRNAMPSSADNRTTRAHEMVFQLNKTRAAFYDADAIREDAEGRPQRRLTSTSEQPGGAGRATAGGQNPCQGGTSTGRNKRSVWEIATEAFPGAHFATFPQKLAEPCILAGTSERGCCPECGAPWERETQRETEHTQRVHNGAYDASSGFGKSGWLPGRTQVATIGWSPSCAHGIEPVPCTVLDPFLGSGTTAYVARRLGRRSIGIELSPEYARMAADRMVQQSLFTEGAA